MRLFYEELVNIGLTKAIQNKLPYYRIMLMIIMIIIFINPNQHFVIKYANKVYIGMIRL